MIATFYNGLLWLAQPLLRIKLRRRGAAEPGYLHAVDERFGHYKDAPDRPLPAPGAPVVWLHAVSLGETRTAAILLKALRAQWPGMQLVLTHGTATGRAAGVALLQPGDVQVWQPWDTRAATQAFVVRYRPDLGILMETEVWPNLVAACQRAAVPLALVNARMSPKSLRGALRAGALMKPVYAGLSAVWAQTEADADRLQQLDAPVRGVCGNLKFDAEPDASLLALGKQWRAGACQPVLMLASSRDGEEAKFFDAIRQRMTRACADKPSPQWLVVPRHPQRFDEVAELAHQRGLHVSRRSEWGAGDAPPQADLWLGDSLGEMTAYYALADVALLGGSFAPLGGQNLIEASACGCPVGMGPHTFNFSQVAADALTAGAAWRAADMSAAIDDACRLVDDRTRHDAMAAAGLAFARQHQGAAGRLAAELAALCGWAKARH